MEENLTAQSFIVRVYRTDTEDRRKITGLVEVIDGSGRQEPFRNADELMALLNCRPAASGINSNKRKKSKSVLNNGGTR